MNQCFLRTAGIMVLALSLHSAGFSQDEMPKEKKDTLRDHEEIIIRKKGDKDTRITVEIKDGQVFINGKPTDEFDDDNISIHKKNLGLHDMGDESFSLTIPDGQHSPFRDMDWSFSRDALSKTSDTKRAYLGVTSEKKEDGGVTITEISKASAAEKAGLMKGDVITKIDDKVVSSPEDLSKIIHQFKPEDKVTVTYTRDGKEQKATALLGKFKMERLQSYSYNYSMPKMESFRGMDIPETPRAFSFNVRPRVGLKAQDTEDGKGVKVLDVDDDSPADKAGIKEGDVITEFDGKAVNSADELAVLSRATREKSSFKIKFKRNDKTQEVEVKIPKKLKTANL